MHRPKSGEKKDVKVLVSEEECEIINVRSRSISSLSFTYVARSFIPLVLSRRFVTSLERTLSKFRISVNMYVYSLSRSLALLSLTLSIQMGGYRPELDVNAADDDEPYKPS